MSFFRSIARIFNPARNVASAVSSANQRQSAIANEARATFLPQTSFSGPRSLSNDNYLFNQEVFNDANRGAVASLFREEYGEDLLSKGDSGYAAQQAQVNSLLLTKRKEIEAASKIQQGNVQIARRERLGDQTGGIRGGIARNPFNMNMMRGPMQAPPPKATVTPVSGGGGAGGAGSGRTYQLL